MLCRDLRRWMKDLEQGCVDLWGAYGDVFRITTMVVALLFILHNSVLCTLHVLYRHRIAQVEFWGSGLVRRLVCLDLQPNVCVGRSGCKTTEAGAGDDLAASI